MRYFIVFLLLVCMNSAAVTPAEALDVSSFAYRRDNVTIHRQNMQPLLPWQSEAIPYPALTWSMEIRDAALFYKQEGWYSLSSPATGQGVMLLFGVPQIAPITASHYFVPLDIVLVNEQGKIIQMLPRLVLADMQEDIFPEQPIAAFIFLASGTIESEALSLGDWVEYKAFKRPPHIIGARKTPAPVGAPLPPVVIKEVSAPKVP